MARQTSRHRDVLSRCWLSCHSPGWVGFCEELEKQRDRHRSYRPLGTGIKVTVITLFWDLLTEMSTTKTSYSSLESADRRVGVELGNRCFLQLSMLLAEISRLVASLSPSLRALLPRSTGSRSVVSRIRGMRTLSTYEHISVYSP